MWQEAAGVHEDHEALGKGILRIAEAMYLEKSLATIVQKVTQDLDRNILETLLSQGRGEVLNQVEVPEGVTEEDLETVSGALEGLLLSFWRKE